MVTHPNRLSWGLSENTLGVIFLTTFHWFLIPSQRDIFGSPNVHTRLAQGHCSYHVFLPGRLLTALQMTDFSSFGTQLKSSLLRNTSPEAISEISLPPLSSIPQHPLSQFAILLLVVAAHGELLDGWVCAVLTLCVAMFLPRNRLSINIH